MKSTAKTAKSKTKTVKTKLPAPKKKSAKLPPLYVVLQKMFACSPAVLWAREYGIDYKRAWNDCQNGNWMTWVLSEVGLRATKIPKPSEGCDCDGCTLARMIGNYSDNEQRIIAKANNVRELVPFCKVLAALKKSRFVR